MSGGHCLSAPSSKLPALSSYKKPLSLGCRRFRVSLSLSLSLSLSIYQTIFLSLFHWVMSRQGNRTPTASVLTSRDSLVRKLRRFLSGKKRRSSSSPLVEDSNKSMASSSAAPQIPWDNYQMVFKYFDQNGDGKVSPSELSICMRTAGEELSEKEAEAVIGSSDSNGDGLLCYDDFVSLVSVKAEEEELREAFGMYEMKGEGCITAESLRRMLRQLGDLKTVEECEVMIRRYDLDGDGVLSFEEFKIMML